MIEINGKEYRPRCPKCKSYFVNWHADIINIIFFKKITFHIECRMCGKFKVNSKEIEVTKE